MNEKGKNPIEITPKSGRRIPLDLSVGVCQDFFLNITDSVKASEFANALTNNVLLVLGKKPLTKENIHDALTKVMWESVKYLN